MAEPRYACGWCGTWQCAACGWKRACASLRYPDHCCGRCASPVGTLLPTMHTERMWRRHNDADTLPEPYAYGERPSGPGTPFGTRTAESRPESYRGVRVPRGGPYQALDLTSWKRGVDDCLKRYPREGERQP